MIQAAPQKYLQKRNCYKIIVLERCCEAVAADPASLHYAVTRRAKAGLSRHSPQDDGGTKRTAGQQPADALKKFSAGGGSRAFKPRVKPMQSAERRRCNQRKIPENIAREWEAGKRGVRRGESRNGCPPPAGKYRAR